MTLFDVDGKSINVHLSAHLINEIDLGEGEAEESTARALLEHHYKQFVKIVCREMTHRSFGLGK